MTRGSEMNKITITRISRDIIIVVTSLAESGKACIKRRVLKIQIR